MRVLFTSVSGLGHVHPMVPLARVMRDRGHDVRWGTGPDVLPRLEAAGIRAVAAGRPFDEERAEFVRRYPEVATTRPEDLPILTFPHLFGEVAPPARLRDLLDLVAGWPPDLVVHEAGEFAGAIAAAKLGIPSVTHAFGALTPEPRVAAAGETVAPLWRSVGLEPRPYGGAYDYLYLDLFPASLTMGDAPHVRSRQPLRPVGFDEAPGVGALELPSGTDRPFVYLTFGTILRDVGPIRRAVDAVSSLDVDLLVTVGPAGDPAALGPQPPSVRVERYVPQSLVLDRCAVVVSHAGSGTFLATVARGIPQLCLPQAADQFLNAAAAADAGVAITLGPAEADGSAISAGVRRLLTDDAFRERAIRVAEEIAAMPGPDDVAAILERL